MPSPFSSAGWAVAAFLALFATATLTAAAPWSEVDNTLRFLREMAHSLPVLQTAWAGSGDNYCQWKYVSCTANEQEVSVNLSWVGVVGRMPEIDDDDINGDKVRVVSIDMSHNPGLQGEFEEDWEDLTRLRYLDLSYTSLRGELPDDWKNMKSLQTVKITNTYACRDLPEWKQPSLRHIDIGNNPNMRGSLKDDWAKLTSLTYVNLVGTDFCGCIPRDFDRVPLLMDAVKLAKPDLLSPTCEKDNRCTSENKQCGNIKPPAEPTDSGSDTTSSDGGRASTASSASAASTDSSSFTPAPAASSSSTASSHVGPNPIIPPRDWTDTKRFLRKLAAQIPAFARTWSDGSILSDNYDDWSDFCRWTGVTCHDNSGRRVVAVHARQDDDGTTTTYPIAISIDTRGVFDQFQVSGFLPELTSPPYDEEEREGGMFINGEKVYIYAISLASHSFLRGRLPTTWGQLTQLRTLDLHGTSVMGTIPLTWASMRALRTLNLANTNICGALPEWGMDASYAALEQERRQSLPAPHARANALSPTGQGSASHNRSSDHACPAAAAAAAAAVVADAEALLPNLDYLDLGGNEFLTGRLPDSWSRLSAIQTVILTDVKGCGCVPASWRSVPALMEAVKQLRNADVVMAQEGLWCEVTNSCSTVTYPPHCEM